jgi:hypothetical protein
VSIQIWQLRSANDAADDADSFRQVQSHSRYDLTFKQEAANKKIAWLHKNEHKVKLFGSSFLLVLDVYGDSTLLLPGHWENTLQPKPAQCHFNAMQYQILEKTPD